MKHSLAKPCIATLMLLINAYAHAYHFEKDGIYYNILSGKDKTVEVTFPATPDSQKPNTNYNGDIEIPETVVFNSNTYTVTSISSKAFMSSALISVSIPSTVTTIESETFCNCTSLESISLPNTLTKINGKAFYGCSSLKSIIIPNSVRYVSERAFMGCTSLESAVLSESMNIIGDHLFSDCHSLKSIAIPSTIESIECGAFASCTSLTSLIIPNSKISIKWFAFCKCTSLETLTISSSVYSIGEGAFGECDNIKKIYCMGNTPPQYTHGDAFSETTRNNAVLYVPTGHRSDYETESPWLLFQNIEEFETAGTEKIEADNYINVAIQDGSIIISGTGDNLIEVVNMHGHTVYQGYNKRITNLPQGLYIVKTGTYTTKIKI